MKVLAISIALVIVASGVAMYGYSGTEGGEGISESEGGKGVISLVAPPFIGVAGAAEAAGGDAFPEDEAGISAYVNLGQPIDLEQVASIFDQINETSATHVIGMVPIPNFGGNTHPHLYADTNGWIVAYFTKDEPASMIMQWSGTDKNNPKITEINTTTLEDAIEDACDAIGVDYAGIKLNIKYYDFEFPDADSILLFVRTRATSGSNYTHVSIPGDYTLYEASYSHYGYEYNNFATSYLKVDGKKINELRWYSTFVTACKQYDIESTLTVGSPHTIEITYSPDSLDRGSAGVANVLIYKSV
ncbi:MAG: hypothetical protein DRI99_06850 [Candidatus Aminicenantes bacterium]|nr:MAG: hypothetical protein DRI99_06850 [Candidatus Aminicenantes bacterium]